MYTIKHAAELVGVSVSTLRAWERRYRLTTPGRTESGYRLYDDESVRTLRLMQRLVADGWSARQAAEEAARRMGERGSAPSRTEVAATTPQTDDVGALVRVAEDFDAVGLAEVLDRQFSHASFETVVDHWLLPAVRELGLAWESGRVTVVGEHLVAHGIIRRLSAAYEAAGSPGRGPRVLVGLPAGVRHEIALLAFAVAARRAGLNTTYLGADVPSDEWAAAAESSRAECVVLAASMPEDLDPLGEVVAALTSTHPKLVLAVGGALQQQAPGACVRLGHEVGPAATRLAELLPSA
jgi:methanogenic corrinoid protein MtbC1